MNETPTRLGAPRAVLRSPQGLVKYCKGGYISGLLSEGYTIVPDDRNHIPGEWERYVEGTEQVTVQATVQATVQPTVQVQPPKRRGRPKGTKNTKTKTTK